MTETLTLYEGAIGAIAKCKSVDEVKGWADRAAATKAYARMAKDKRLEVDAAEIRIRAERRLGEMLAEQKSSGNMAKGHRFAGGPREVPPAVTLAEVGIDKNLSARAQKLAAVPNAVFEAEVDEWRGRVEAEGERVTARLERAGAAAAVPDVEPEDDESARIDDLAMELETLGAVVAADDKLKAATDALLLEKRAHAQTRAMFDSKCQQLADMTREAKRWRRRAEAAEKAVPK